MGELFSFKFELNVWNKNLITPVPTLSEDSKVNDALNYFTSNQIYRVAIVKNNAKLVGILDCLDILRYLKDNSPLSPFNSIKPLIKQPELILYEENDVEYNINQIIEKGYTSAYTVDYKGNLKGELRLETLAQLVKNELREIRFYTSQVIDSVDSAVIAVDTDGKIVFFNKAAEVLFKTKTEEAIGNHVVNIIPKSKTYKVLESGKELRDVRMSIRGRNLLADFYPIRFQEDKILGAVGILKDVTELDAVTQRLTTSEKLMATLEAVVENSYEGMVVIDEQNRIILMNQFFLDVIGKESHEVIGKPIDEISSDSLLPQTVETGKAQFGETWHLGGKDFIIMRIPIERDGKIVGAIAKTLFKNMEIAKMFAKKVMRLEEDLAYYKEELGRIHSSRFVLDDIIGESPPMKEAKALARRAAQTSSTVLILGESGTGKELFSHAIHEASLRRKGPFIKVNCAALPENLLESELFGYVEGAFTGARKGGKPGKFELADKGTIFLDEIGDMTLAMQAKLLRVLQEREVERLGGTESIRIDVRIIAATNRDLHQMVMDHEFRLDLYYRLNVLPIQLPPLRERKEDIPLIAEAIIEKINSRMGLNIKGLAPESIIHLLAYDWPGNIRELENILERAMIICDEEWIQPKHLSLVSNSDKKVKPVQKRLHAALEEAEREIIVGALRQTQGNKVQAAKLLGIHRSVLYKKLTKYDIDE